MTTATTTTAAITIHNQVMFFGSLSVVATEESALEEVAAEEVASEEVSAVEAAAEEVTSEEVSSTDAVSEEASATEDSASEEVVVVLMLGITISSTSFGSTTSKVIRSISIL